MPKYIDLDDDRIKFLYIKKNKTCNEIAEIMKVSAVTIKRRLKNLGVRRGPKYNLLENSFGIKNKESCYWAGLIAADGCVMEIPRSKFIISLKSSDLRHLHKFCNFIGREEESVKLRKRVKFGKEFESAILEVGNKPIIKDLINNFNIVPAKSLILKSPDLKSEDNIRSYIRGYFDGDGCNSLKDNYIIFNITSGSEHIINWIKDNIFKYTNVVIPKYCYDSIYRISTSCGKAKSIMDWIYLDSTESTRLTRKYERYIWIKEN